MKWKAVVTLWVVLGLSLLVGCSNDSIGSLSPSNRSNPWLTQAPPPAFRPPPSYPGGPLFSPELPPNMPQPFYPWIPIYSFFYQQPTLTYLWTPIWNQWQNYSYSNGCDLYDFNTFWNQYFPTVWTGSTYRLFYQYMDDTFYSWMGGGVSLPYTVNSNAFWGNYSGLSYTTVFSYMSW